ncbi:uncharacterized protein [Miscanthus floridulus]|uniref:uncharacterized protein n=1 Tax=Miscanthus floridulus TaxID=154761 RepID=UPI0034586D72
MDGDDSMDPADLYSMDDFLQEQEILDDLGDHIVAEMQSVADVIQGGRNQLDEYLKMGESTGVECLKKFVQGVIAVYGEEYLRRPTVQDVERLLEIGERRGFPGMIGSIDCMHWHWEKCPYAWKGQYTRGDQGVPTIILEAVASHDRWIWHAFFGVAGSNNDINVLNQSTLFVDQLRGEAPQVQYFVNGRQYSKPYYLADGIYPEWAVFVKSIRAPQSAEHKLFSEHQVWVGSALKCCGMMMGPGLSGPAHGPSSLLVPPILPAGGG